MKQNDLKDTTYTLTPQAYENIFNIYTDEDEQYYYNLLRTVNFPEELDKSTYVEYVVTHNDTWPILAWRAYRNVKMWWVIVAANQIIDPTVLPIPGSKLKVIKPETVRSLLNFIKKN